VCRSSLIARFCCRKKEEDAQENEEEREEEGECARERE